MLNKLANSFHITAHTIFAEGHAGPEIIRIAAEQNADLLVVGTHGYTGWNRLALGSVSEYIVRHSPCAVLTIKPTENELYKTG
jgi:nucleotide-binding universal stress UspA family protein